MTYGAFEQIKDSIMNEVLYILDCIRKDRSFLNKHFQNSINNYFLEDYAGSFLKEYLNMPRAKDITKFIQNKYNGSKGTKYMKLMSGYISELEESNQINQFKSLLHQNMQSESCDNNKQSKEWQSNVWKKAFSLFVLHFIQFNNLKGIFEIWNSLFPRNKILRKRQENVIHRDDEFQDVEINNVRKINSSSNLNLTDAQKQAINNMNQTLFGNEFKSGIVYPDNKNQQYHLKQQFEYTVVPQIQIQQQPIQQQQQQQQYKPIYSNQPSTPINNQIFEDSIVEPDQINFDLPQQNDNINDFFINIQNQEDDLQESNSSSASPVLINCSNQMKNYIQYDQFQQQPIQQQQSFQYQQQYQQQQQYQHQQQYQNQQQYQQYNQQQQEIMEPMILNRNNSYQQLLLNQSINNQYCETNNNFLSQLENDNDDCFSLKFFTNTFNNQEQINFQDMTYSIHSYNQQSNLNTYA